MSKSSDRYEPCPTEDQQPLRDNGCRRIAQLRHRILRIRAARFFAYFVGVVLNLISIASVLPLVFLPNGTKFRPMYLGFVWAFCIFIGGSVSLGLSFVYCLYGNRKKLRYLIRPILVCIAPYLLGMILLMAIILFKDIELPP